MTAETLRRAIFLGQQHAVHAVHAVHSAQDCGENNGQYRVYTALARGRVS